MSNDVTLSLLLPTRGRPALVKRLFDSIADTTHDPSKLEVVLYIDNDDAATLDITYNALSLIKLIEPPGRTMGYMNQACYQASHGQYVVLMNDDAEFRIENWDCKIIEAFGKFPDQVALVYGNDLHRGAKIPTFPILSRTVCQLLGGVCPRDYQNVYIDLHLLDLFKKLAQLGHNRIVYLEEVVFEHMHHEAGKAIMDEVYVKKNERADDFLFIALEDERQSKAESLVRYIETKNSSHSKRILTASTQVQPADLRKKSIMKRFFSRLLG